MSSGSMLDEGMPGAPRPRRNGAGPGDVDAAAIGGPAMGAAPALSPRLLDQLRHQVRYRHYSLRTEEACVHRVRAFLR